MKRKANKNKGEGLSIVTMTSDQWSILREDLRGVPTTPEDVLKVEREFRKLMVTGKGIGLAANQAGLRLDFFGLSHQLGLKHRSDRQESMCTFCINPEWEPEGVETRQGVEGCLSLPGLEVTVIRHHQIKASWTDLDGKRVWARLLGYPARVFQHEYDHLRGVLISDVGKSR